MTPKEKKQKVQTVDKEIQKSYTIGVSNIHGKGIIAGKNIKKGYVIGTPLLIKYYIIIDITQDLGIWLNHSWCPNAKLVKRENELIWDLVSIQDIKKGDEITMDYRETPWFIAKPYMWYQ